MIKSLKSNKSLSTLSTDELKTVKGGGLSTSVNASISLIDKLTSAGDPPPEIEDNRCFFM